MYAETGEKIRQLCRKVIELPERDCELEPALRELRTTIHEHLNRTRERVIELAFVTAQENQKKAA
jgi:hypothetical protein